MKKDHLTWSLSLSGQYFAALLAASGENFASVLRAHPAAESVYLLALVYVRLKCRSHFLIPPKYRVNGTAVRLKGDATFRGQIRSSSARSPYEFIELKKNSYVHLLNHKRAWKSMKSKLDDFGRYSHVHKKGEKKDWCAILSKLRTEYQQYLVLCTESIHKLLKLWITRRIPLN